MESHLSLEREHEMSSRILFAGRSCAEVIARSSVAGHGFCREKQSRRYRAGLRLRVGVSLTIGLIWTNAALGDHDELTFILAADYEVFDSPRFVAIGYLTATRCPTWSRPTSKAVTSRYYWGSATGRFSPRRTPPREARLPYSITVRSARAAHIRTRNRTADVSHCTLESHTGSAEVASALVAHGNVSEAAVVGFPHEIKA